jgi:SAM-dependent methyltransferase
MTGTTHSHRHFVPAAGHAWLLPLYDPLGRLLGADRVKRTLIERTELQPGERVLDVGCGTGDLALLAKELQPGADVVGVDPDPAALARAATKAERRGLYVDFDEGFGNDLPYDTASFDRAVSSFVFHHLDTETKRGTLRELVRVLRPGGSLFLMDFGPPRGGLLQTIGRLLHRSETLRDNTPDEIPELMREAGFAEAEQISGEDRVVGTVYTYRACTSQRAMAR